jgi:hypothetical protein
LVERILFTCHTTFLLLDFPLFGNNSLFGLSVVFDLAGSIADMYGHFLVNNGTEEVRFLGRLDRTSFLEIVKVSRIFHQLIQQF